VFSQVSVAMRNRYSSFNSHPKGPASARAEDGLWRVFSPAISHVLRSAFRAVLSGAVLALFAANASAQCPGNNSGTGGNYNANEGNRAISTASPTCDTWVGLPDGAGSGSRRTYTGFDANTVYQIRTGTGGQNVGNITRDGNDQGATTITVSGSTSYSLGRFRNAAIGCGTWNSSSALLEYRKVTPTLTANTTGATTVCTGGSVSIGGGTASNGTRYWQGSTSNGSSVATSGSPNSTGALNSVGSFPFYYRPNNNGCWGTQQSTTVTVVAQPSAPTGLTKAPNVNDVCVGQTLSVSSPIGGNPGVSCADVHYSFYRNGSYMFGPSATASYTTVAGDAGTTITVRAQRVSCTGAGCNTTSSLSGDLVSWVVAAQPAPPTTIASKTPNLSTVCAGTAVSISSPSGGTSGVGCNTFEYEFRRGATVVRSWGTGASYTTLVGDVGGTITVFVRRTGCTAGVGCNTSAESASLASWAVVAQPQPPTGGITKSPNVAEVCVGQSVSVTGTPTGGNPGDGCGFQYRFLRGATEVQTWGGASYTTQAADVGSVINVQVRRANCTSGAGCNTSIESSNLVSWTVRAQPTISIAVTSSPICSGTDQAVLTATINTSVGCSTSWEQSTTGTGGWVAASGTVSGNTFTTSPLTQTLFFRAVRNCTSTNTNCTAQVISSPVVSVVVPGGPTPTGVNNVQGCGSASVNVAVSSGNEARFYSALTGGVPSGAFVAGTSITTTSDITYYVTEYNPTTGCESSVYSTFIVDVTPTFTVTMSQTPITCHNGTNGSVTVTVNSPVVGTQYSYQWSNGANVPLSGSTSNTQTNLATGPYSVQVNDNGGCVAFGSLQLNQPSPVTVTGSVVNVNCNGGSAGSSITLVPTGGSNVFSGGSAGFTWSDGPTTQNRSNVVAGNYTVTARDNNGCASAPTVFTVGQPAAVALQTNLSYICNASGFTGATVTLVGAGGVGGYTFANSSNCASAVYSATSSFNITTNGTYNYCVRDANGCTASGSVAVTLIGSAVASTVSCGLIYVKSDGSGNLGVKDCPTSFLGALAIYAGDPTRNTILVYEGTYNINSTKVAIPAGVTIIGGYVANPQGEWVQSSASASNIFINSPPLEQPTVGGVQVGQYIGIEPTGNNFKLRNLNFSVMPGGASGTTNSRGRSIYGIYLNGRTGFEITRCTITTGAASNGTAGGNGRNASDHGGNGGNGGNGQSEGNCNASSYINGGGAGAAGSVPWGANGGSGGKGGDSWEGGGQNGSNSGGSPFGNGNVAGGGGLGSDGGDCGTGGNGGSGAGGICIVPVGGNPCANTYSLTPGANYGSTPAGASHSFSNYYVPSGQAAQAGHGYGGTGGGGGGATRGENTAWFCPYDDNSGNSGGGGGGGGAGGEGGFGGFGGGASLAIYANASTGTVHGSSLNPGSGGSGGVGGNGGLGGLGGNPGQFNCNCSGDRACSGWGGPGAPGTAGGKGQNGATGASQGIFGLSQSGGTTVPTVGAPVVNAFRGCTNSEIVLSKTGGGDWNIGVGGGSFINNVNSGQSSFAVNQSPVSIFYGTVGSKEVIIGSTSYLGLVEVGQTRTLPTFNIVYTPPAGVLTTVVNTSATIPSPLSLCRTQQVTFTVAGTHEAIEWKVAGNDPNGGGGATASATHTFNSAGTFHVRLRVKDICCGWSIPIWATVVVTDVPTVATSLSRASNPNPSNPWGFCDGAVAVITANGVTGSPTSYVWTLPSGSSAPSLTTATNQISVTFGPNAGNITVRGVNACGNGPIYSQAITINADPSVSVSGTTAICTGTSTVLTGGVSAGPGALAPLSYAWTGGSIASGAGAQSMTTANLAANTNYTLTVTNGNACAGTANVTVTIQTPPTAPTGITGTTTICYNTPTTLTADGGTEGSGATYQWGTVAVGSNIIGGATSVSYTTPALTGNTTYWVRRVGSTSCTSSTGGVTQLVTVRGAVVSGTIASGNDTICVGGDPADITLSTPASGGSGTFNYQWYYQDGTPACPTGTSAVGWTSIAGATSSNYNPPSGLLATRTYAVMVDPTGSPDCGVSTWASSCRVVTVVADPTLSAPTASTTICAGGSVNLTSTLANGTGTMTPVWEYSSTGDPGTWATVSNNVPVGASYTNQGTATITIGGITAAGTHYFRRSLTNTATGCDAISATAAIVVNADFSVSAPSYTNATICRNGSTAVSATVSGGTGTPTLQWEYLNGATWGSVVNGTPANATYANATTNTMTISGDIAPGTYQYRLRATSAVSGCQDAFSVGGTLTIVADPSLSAPAASTNICSGGSVTLTSDLTNGTGTMNPVWEYSANGSTLWATVVNGTPAGASYSNQGTASVTVSGITGTGTYYYRRNLAATGLGCDAVSANAAVTVVVDPSVTVPSFTNATVCSGGSTVVSATVSGGTGAATLQWQYYNGSTWGNVVNGTPAGASYTGAGTASMTIANTTAAGTHEYRLSVSYAGSGCDAVFSAASNYTVIAVPDQPSLVTGDATICTGTSSTYSVTNVAGVTYAWSYSGTSSVAPSGTSNSVTFTPTGSGTLTVTPSNTCGNGTARTFAITVRPAATASISGTTTVCQFDASPNITFTNPTAFPIVVTYTVNGGSNQFISVAASASASVAVSTGAGGVFTYQLASAAYQTAPTCATVLSATAVVTVNPLAEITSVTGTSPLCIGQTPTYSANGVVLGGGTGAWSSSGPAVASVNGSGIVTALTAGTTNIRYTITGGCGGTVLAEQVLTVHPNAAVGSVSGTSPLCVGGVATYTVTGVNLGGTGVGAWTSSNNGQATVSSAGEVTAVAPGVPNIIYTVTGGCGGTPFAQQGVTVITTTTTAPTSINAAPGSTICNGGSVTLTASGGVEGTATYEWGTGTVGSNVISGATTSSIVVSGLSADTQYWVRRVGSVTCPVTTAEATITVTLDQTISITDEGTVLCSDPAGSTLTATFSGGAAPCTLQWQVSTTSATTGFADVSGATGTTYNTGALTAAIWVRVVRTCAGGCPAAVSGVTEVYPIGLPSLASTTITGCGAATIAPTIGLGGNTIRFYGPNSTTSLLSTGTSYSTFAVGGPDDYHVTSYNTVNGCESAQLDLTLNVSAAYSMSLSSVNYNGFGVSCAFSNDGSVTATAGGSAVQPITYAWSNFVTNTVSSSTNTINALVAGRYVVVTTDDANCFATDTIVLTSPPVLNAAVTPSNFSGWNLSCNGSNTGSITAVPSGGVSPYTYSWTSTPAGFTGTNAVADELISRTYNLTVTDANGCTYNRSVPMTEPSAITFTTNTGYVCSGNQYLSATVTVTPSGGASATYEYRRTAAGPGAWQAWQPSNVFGGLTNGVYSFQVRDAANPTCVGASQDRTIALPPDGTVIDACNFIYVSAAGDPSGTLGQKDCPVTLSQAIQIYNGDPSRNHILMLSGNYSYNQKITLPGGLTVDGRYVQSGTDWVKSSSATTSITLSPPLEETTVSGVQVGHYIGMQVAGNNVSLRDLNINVSPDLGAGVTNGRGRSVYGVYIAGQTGVNISRCQVQTAAAAAGPNGVAVSPSVGGGGAGGAGGTISPVPSAALSCPVTSVAGVGGAGGQSGSSAGGIGGTGGSSCTKTTPACVGCNGGTGGAGANGVAGTSFTVGDTPLAALGLEQFFVPQSGANGGNGSGGGGGGRGGDGAGGVCPNVDVLPGQPGGAGGAGGAGGNGGGGGGSSVAVYAFGGSGSFTDCVFTAGTAGTGGLGTAGATGAPGAPGSGYSSPTGCDGLGGAGGAGGVGGNGGRGQDGAAGISQALVQLNGASFSQVGSSVPNNGTITASWFRGCRNSEIALSKTAGANWSGIGSDPAFVNDLTASTTSHAVSGNNVSIFFPSSSALGPKNIGIVGTTLNRYIQLYDDRLVTMLPTTINEILSPCPTSPITLGTNLTGGQISNITQWDWKVSLLSTPGTPLYSFASSAPGAVPAPSGGWLAGQTYQVRLRVFEACCGWSIPVYRTFTVAPQLSPASPITASNTGVICEGTTVTYSVGAVLGATTYNWTAPGGTIQSGQGTQSITVLWGAANASASVTVYPSNSCPASDGPLTTLPQSINGRPNTLSIIAQTGSLTYCHPGSVTLRALASTGGGAGTNSYTYLWSPGSTTGQDLSVTPSATGTYPYSVTVTENGSGCFSSVSTNLVAQEPATVNAGLDNNACQSATPAAITLSGSSFGGSATSATWTSSDPAAGTFGNVSPAAPAAVTFTPAANWFGTVTLTLTTNDPAGACGAVTDARTVTVHPAPTVVLATGVQDQSVCADVAISTTTYTLGGGATGASVSGLGTLSSNVSGGTVTISGTPTASGTYTITTTGQHGSCSAASISGTITVNQPPVVTVGASGPLDFCAGSSVTLTSTAGASYLWSTGATTQAITVSSSGSYSVTMTDGNGCSGTSPASVVTVYPVPTVVLSTGTQNQTVCAGVGIVTTTYTFGGGATGVTVSGLPTNMSASVSGSTVSITGNPAASGTYTVTTTGQHVSCAAATISGIITVNPLPSVSITAGGPLNFCTGGSVTLTSTAGTSYLWSPGGATTQGITVSSSGSYTVTMTDGNGCFATSAPVLVTQHPEPTLVLATGVQNQTVCAGVSIVTTTYTLGGGATGADVTGLPAGLSASVSFPTVTISGSPTATGTYTITTTGQDASCAAATLAGTITVNTPPVATISAGGPVEFCAGGSVTLTSTAGTSYLWNPGGAITQGITVSSSGSYTVTVTGANGCSQTSAPTLVTAHPAPNLVLAGASNPASQSVCPGVAIGAITYDFGGSATGVTVSGLPAGLSHSLSGSSVIITGSPTSSGTYTISTTGQNATCAPAQLSGTITVYPTPVATISAGGPIDFCQGGSVTLTASGGTSYVWSTSATTASISVNTSGSYTVVATDANSCQATSAATVITVYPAPTITYASGPLSQSHCAGQSISNVVFTLGGSASGVSVTGLPSGVTASVSGNTVTISGTSSTDGTFNYSISTTGQNALCAAAPASGSIVYNPLPAIPVITAGGPTTFCQGGSVQLNSSQPSGNNWSTGATTASITVSASGSYTVTYTDGNGCESTSAPTSVTVNPLPTATIDYQTAPFCPVGSGVVTRTGQANGTYSSTVGLDIDGTSGTINLGNSTPGSYIVTYSFSDVNSCANTATDNIVIVALPTASISYSGAPFCATGTASVNHSGTSGGVYSAPSGLAINASTGQINLGASTPGTYTVTYSFDNSGSSPPVVCSNTATTSVTVNALPNVLAGSDASICLGGSVQLTASGAVSYAWSPSVNLDDDDISNPTFNGTTTTLLTVVGTDANGCVDTDDVQITVNALPVVSITPSGATTFCSGGSVNLNAGTGWNAHVWNESGTPLTPAQTAQIITVSTSGSYTVTVTDGNGCSGSSAAVAVTVNPLPAISITPAGSQVICGGSLLLTAAPASGLTYQWLLNGGNISGQTSATYSSSANGDYQVRVNDGTCENVSNTVQLTVNQAPVLSLVTVGQDDQTVCSGLAITSTAWQFSAGATGVSVTYSPAPSGLTHSVSGNTVTISGTPTATVTYTIETTGQLAPCVAAIVDGTITVNVPSTVDAGGPQDVCQSASPSAITLTGATIGGGATTGTWSIMSGSGTLSSTSPVTNPASVSFTPSVGFAGTVQLMLTSNAATGCTVQTDMRMIEVRELPTASSLPNDTICSSVYTISGLLENTIVYGGSATGATWSVLTSTPAGANLGFTGFTTQPDTVTASVPNGFVGQVTFGFVTDDPYSCGAASSQYTVVIQGPQLTTTWTGSFSDDWFDSRNWTNCVPGAITAAIIPQLFNPLITPYPRITGFNATCNTIEIQGTASVEITGNWQLEVTQ
jgi:hypothetical protein